MPGTECPSKPAIVSSEKPISAAVAAKECLNTCIVTPSKPALAQMRSSTFGRPTKCPSPWDAGNTQGQTSRNRLRLNQYYGLGTYRPKLRAAFGILEADASGMAIYT